MISAPPLAPLVLKVLMFPEVSKVYDKAGSTW